MPLPRRSRVLMPALGLALTLASPVRAADYEKPLAPAITLNTVAMTGVWSLRGNEIEVGTPGGQLSLTLRRFDKGSLVETMTVPLSVYSTGNEVNGYWRRDGKSGQLRLALVSLPGTSVRGLKLTHVAGDPVPVLPPETYQQRRFSELTGDLARYVGAWKVSGGKLLLDIDGDRLRGKFLQGPDGLQQHLEDLLFSPFIARTDGQLGGAWARKSDGGGDEASLQISDDNKQMILRETRYGHVRQDLLTRIAEPVTGQSGAPQIIPGTASPRAGYTPCGSSWCEVKLDRVDTELVNYNGDFNVVRQTYVLRVHNRTGVVRPIVGWNATSGAPAPDVLRIRVGTSNIVGPIVAPTDAGVATIKDFQALRQLNVPGGAEAVLRYSAFFLPNRSNDLKTLDVDLAGGAPMRFDVRRSSCTYWATSNKGLDDGQIDKNWPRFTPDFCAGLDAEDAAAAKAAQAEKAAQAAAAAEQAKADAAAARQTAAAPTSGVLTAAPAGTDGLVPLGKVALKLESVTRRADGRTEVVATVKNISTGIYYLTSGNIILFGEAADGITHQATQPWRAGIEPPAVFSSTPSIMPGGQVRARWMILGDKDYVVTRVSAQEGGKLAPLN